MQGKLKAYQLSNLKTHSKDLTTVLVKSGYKLISFNIKYNQRITKKMLLSQENRQLMEMNVVAIQILKTTKKFKAVLLLCL